MSEIEVTFLDTILYKGDSNESTLDEQTHYNSETFQYTNSCPYSCHPRHKEGFINGEALRLVTRKMLS